MGKQMIFNSKSVLISVLLGINLLLGFMSLTIAGEEFEKYTNL